MFRLELLNAPHSFLTARFNKVKVLIHSCAKGVYATVYKLDRLMEGLAPDVSALSTQHSYSCGREPIGTNLTLLLLASIEAPFLGLGRQRK